MDDIDRAQEREESDRAYAIGEALRAVPELPAQGLCYNCQSIVPSGVRWCDSDCCNDYIIRRNAEVRRSGRCHD